MAFPSGADVQPCKIVYIPSKIFKWNVYKMAKYMAKLQGLNTIFISKVVCKVIPLFAGRCTKMSQSAKSILISNTLKSETTAFLGVLWAQYAQSAPRKADDLPLMVDIMTCWYSSEMSFNEEFKYEILILMLSNLCESVYVQTQTAKS